MCKVAAYLVTDVMIVINLSHNINFITIVIYTESKTPYSMINCTYLPTSSSSSISGSIVTSTPTVTPGK